MKTRDRILAAALALFNEDSASALSAVDIAAALSISPGHLYYHFKGKAEIVAALFDNYLAESAIVLASAEEDAARSEFSVDDMQVHIHILLEEASDARFLFREAGALLARDSGLAPRYRRVMAAQLAAVRAMLAQLAKRRAIRAGPELRQNLAHQIVLGVCFKLVQLELEGEGAPRRERIARAAAQIMAPVAALA